MGKMGKFFFKQKMKAKVTVKNFFGYLFAALNGLVEVDRYG